MNEYSNIFGERKYRAYQILEEFCNKYYDNKLYNTLIRWENHIKEDLNYRLKTFINLYKDNDCLDVLESQIPKLVEKFVADWLVTDVEPNGKNKYPDYIIDVYDYKNIYIDAKCVAYISRKYNDTDNPILVYNNGCGQIKETAENILAHYNGEYNSFYRSFILFIYYNEDGIIEDTIFMPTIYAINLRAYNWDDLNSFMFGVKGATNSNITISLPSFLKKTGMMDLEEKECALATATYNYLKNNNYYNEDNTTN